MEKTGRGTAARLIRGGTNHDTVCSGEDQSRWPSPKKLLEIKSIINSFQSIKRERTIKISMEEFTHVTPSYFCYFFFLRITSHAGLRLVSWHVIMSTILPSLAPVPILVCSCNLPHYPHIMLIIWLSSGRHRRILSNYIQCLCQLASVVIKRILCALFNFTSTNHLQ